MFSMDVQKHRRIRKPIKFVGLKFKLIKTSLRVIDSYITPLISSISI